MTAQRVTIFGGSGFVGRAVTQRLARAGHQIRIAVRDPNAALAMKPLGEVGQITPIAASVTRPETLPPALRDADAVINLTGILYESGRQTFDAVHRRGAEAVALAAKDAGARRFVQMSALGADLEGRSRYARSKAQGEEAVRALFPDAAILRPSVIFGPRDGFFGRFAQMSLFSPALPLIGGGATRFQPVYVGDVAEATTRLLATRQGGVWELGGPAIYSFREALELMLRYIGRHRGLIPIPWLPATIIAFVAEKLPAPLLTRDQLLLLRRDNILSGTLPGLRELGISPTALETVLPEYMSAFGKGEALATV